MPDRLVRLRSAVPRVPGRKSVPGAADNEKAASFTIDQVMDSMRSAMSR
jgi:hypothetical protein